MNHNKEKRIIWKKRNIEHIIALWTAQISVAWFVLAKFLDHWGTDH